MDTSELEATLDTLDGWKRINKKFMFLFGGGAKSFDVWQAAEHKCVVEQFVVREEEYDGFRYYVYAFSTKGAPSAETLAELRDAVEHIPLGTLRFEAQSYPSLTKIRGIDDDEYDVVQFSRPDEGLFVQVIGDDKRHYPAVAYAYSGGTHNCFPIESKFV